MTRHPNEVPLAETNVVAVSHCVDCKSAPPLKQDLTASASHAAGMTSTNKSAESPGIFAEIKMLLPYD